MAVEQKEIFSNENGIVFNDLNIATATADQKKMILKTGNGLSHPVIFQSQVVWSGFNVTTDVVRVYQKVRKDSSVAPQVENTTDHVLALNSASGNGFIKVYPTGSEYFEVRVEGATLGSDPTSTSGTLSIDYAAKQ